MSLRRVARTVARSLTDHGFVAEPEQDGFIDLVRHDDRARQVVQLQCSPPSAFRSGLRLPGMVPPMLTANLLVDHAATAMAFGRTLGMWPAPVEERLGMVVGGSDHWWVLGRSEHALGTCLKDPDELAASLLGVLLAHGLPFLAAVSDPAVAHARNLAADRPQFAAELAWVSGDEVAARTAREEVRALLARRPLADPPTSGQQQLLDALERLDTVLGVP